DHLKLFQELVDRNTLSRLLALQDLLGQAATGSTHVNTWLALGRLQNPQMIQRFNIRGPLDDTDDLSHIAGKMIPIADSAASHGAGPSGMPAGGLIQMITAIKLGDHVARNFRPIISEEMKAQVRSRRGDFSRPMPPAKARDKVTR